MRHIDARDDVEPTFARLVGHMAEAFGVEITERRIKAYARALDELTLEQVAAACRACMLESRFFPTVGELARQARPSADDAALLAWSGLEQAAATVGAWASLQVEDGAAAEALVRVFGSWPEFCAQTEQALGARRVEYLAAYREARRHNRPARRLEGLCEAAGQPPGGLAAGAVACGRLRAGGQVETLRGLPQLGGGDGDGHARAALAEAGAAGAGEAAPGPARGRGGPRRPPGGGGA